MAWTKADFEAGRRVLLLIAQWRHEALPDPEEWSRRDHQLGRLEALLRKASGNESLVRPPD
jgi:hypothetical protein